MEGFVKAILLEGPLKRILRQGASKLSPASRGISNVRAGSSAAGKRVRGARLRGSTEMKVVAAYNSAWESAPRSENRGSWATG